MISFSEIVIYSVWITHFGASDISLAPIFYKSQNALILLLLLSKSQPLALGCDLVKYGAAERPQNGFLFQKEGHDVVSLFFLLCVHTTYVPLLLGNSDYSSLCRHSSRQVSNHWQAACSRKIPPNKTR